MRMYSRYRWFVVFVFFLFMLLHQTDLLMINSLIKPIMDTFHLDEMQIGFIQSGSLLVAACLFPVWGYLYDRYARAKLLALAALIWGSTTWLGAIAPNYPSFMAARASTGIDDASYPGLYSLIADYFPPGMRSKVFGLLQVAQPLGFLLGMILALTLGAVIGWRNVFLLTGGMGIVIAAVIFFGVREVPRGQSEPELENLDHLEKVPFNWKAALGLFRKRSLLLIFAQGFAGVFPWNVITTWFLYYLETERNYTADERMLTMAPVILILAGGYFLGGVLGDALFRRTPRGRLIICLTGVLMGTILLWATMAVPVQDKTLFFFLLAATALVLPFSSPNIASTVYDITPPEVRSTALAIESFIENIGSASAPALAGIIAARYSTQSSILWICTVAWVLCTLFLAGAVVLIPRDIAALRQQLRERAERQTSNTPAPIAGA
jgi:MFS transporter, Spinster family, sphingosine-1-phosphate transporter